MGIISFKGVKRRFEYIRDYRGVPVIIDYAHHPTEISSSISGIKSVYKSVLCVFQPHTFSRTLTLMSEFKCCFKGVDTLAIFRTYKAREKSIIGGRAVDLYRECKVKDKVYINSKRALKEYLDTNNLSKYDVVLVLGAGDIADIVASF